MKVMKELARSGTTQNEEMQVQMKRASEAREGENELFLLTESKQVRHNSRKYNLT